MFQHCLINNKLQNALQARTQLQKVTDVSVKEGVCGAQKVMKEKKEMKPDVVG